MLDDNSLLLNFNYTYCWYCLSYCKSEQNVQAWPEEWRTSYMKTIFKKKKCEKLMNMSLDTEGLSRDERLVSYWPHSWGRGCQPGTKNTRSALFMFLKNIFHPGPFDPFRPCLNPSNKNYYKWKVKTVNFS